MEDTLRIFDKGPGPRKAITLRTRQQQALMGLIDDKNGAERVILEELTWAVLHGDAIEPIFQSVVNAITARAIVCEKLPLKPKGRPKDISNDIGWSVAYQYFALKDGGVSYEKSVAEVAAEFCKDERHIMRLVKENKSRIGVTPDARKKTRTWFDGTSGGRELCITKWDWRYP